MAVCILVKLSMARFNLMKVQSATPRLVASCASANGWWLGVEFQGKKAELPLPTLTKQFVRATHIPAYIILASRACTL